jgi:hypothetical protein
MSLKRGLTRLYVVLWALWAIATGCYAGFETNQTVRAVRLAREYVPERAPVVYAEGFVPDIAPDTNSSVIYFGPDSSARVSFPAGASESLVKVVMLREVPSVIRNAEHKAAVAAAVLDERRPHAARHIVETLGLWLLAGIIVPGAALFGIRWVWAGFERRSGLPDGEAL